MRFSVGPVSAAFFLALLLADCTAVPEPSPVEEGACTASFITEVPIHRIGKVLLIPATLNDQSTNFVLDTGSEVTILTIDALPKPPLHPGPYFYFQGIGGNLTTDRVVARKLAIGSLQSTNLKLLEARFKLKMPGRTISGILGRDLLDAFDLDLDVPNGKLRFFRPAGACRTPAVALKGELYSVPMMKSDSTYDPRLDVQVEVEGKRLRAELDTGSPQTTLFAGASRAVGDKLGNVKGARHFYMLGYTASYANAIMRMMPPMTIGELTIAHLPVDVVDQYSIGLDDMLLGMDFISRVHLWISFSSRTVIMQYPPLPSPEVPGTSTASR